MRVKWNNAWNSIYNYINKCWTLIAEYLIFWLSKFSIMKWSKGKFSQNCSQDWMRSKKSDSAWLLVTQQILVFLLKIFRVNLKADLHAQLDISWFKTVFLNIFWGLLIPLISSWKQQLFFQEIYTCTYKHTTCTQVQLFYGSVHGSMESRLNSMLYRAPWLGLKIHK